MARQKFIVRRMDKRNDSIHFWLDVSIGKYWYVFMWRKGKSPYMYRSIDATPPHATNEGKWLFGRSNHD